MTEARTAELWDGRVYAPDAIAAAESGEHETPETQSTPFNIMEHMINDSEHRLPRYIAGTLLLRKVRHDTAGAKQTDGFIRQRQALDLHYVLLAVELLNLGILQRYRAPWRERLGRAFLTVGYVTRRRARVGSDLLAKARNALRRDNRENPAVSGRNP